MLSNLLLLTSLVTISEWCRKCAYVLSVTVRAASYQLAARCQLITQNEFLLFRLLPAAAAAAAVPLTHSALTALCLTDSSALNPYFGGLIVPAQSAATDADYNHSGCKVASWF